MTPTAAPASRESVIRIGYDWRCDHGRSRPEAGEEVIYPVCSTAAKKSRTFHTAPPPLLPTLTGPSVSTETELLLLPTLTARSASDKRLRADSYGSGRRIARDGLRSQSTVQSQHAAKPRNYSTKTTTPSAPDQTVCRRRRIVTSSSHTTYATTMPYLTWLPRCSGDAAWRATCTIRRG